MYHLAVQQDISPRIQQVGSSPQECQEHVSFDKKSRHVNLSPATFSTICA
jgi:hypothetical protein